ncbi:MAG: hypothetical protein COW04_11510 [Deltaproteobacteria bacterium CG12_big_fil_rev_8_21_14_0_65_43_10]|nr:MAG: hypothetical protein AUK23_02860 [Deltaproteobacteria bacterium CG2_30_43_15]PIQ44709.1 MAG: hypothetical protein COW04_11510 [Deltaproteobacteria bacterium CG12_big_fil_rev_8_21_14_0_65_43_10]PIU84948.1 MAG: hypothetical protein COS67_10465 [Deltaproteobacteria bacterium CG06_land_8_20_14_3_00_44_19]PIX21988.1 MAG: hypothetical protein COZ68_13375 [Deltaproteobacteria bacterium CG_4_8_14_3_um_filter_43_13]PJB38465.1 MAG: hypothetical protein CO106_12560 [Deltaproteobacteria bacterium C
MLKRSVDINAIGRGLSPVVALDRDFFEHIAKLRAARRIWARTMKEKWGATDPKAMCLRAHGVVVGTVCTRQQPLVNIARGGIAGLAGILGGCMGLQVACYDETWSTPTEEAERVAIRTQQVLRYESGVTSVADPLAGSYYVEWLTSKLEEEIQAMVDKIEGMGGWMAALQNGWVHEEVKKGLLDIQRKIDNGERTVVGVNRFQIPTEEDFKPKLYALRILQMSINIWMTIGILRKRGITKTSRRKSRTYKRQLPIPVKISFHMYSRHWKPTLLLQR